MTEQNRQTKEGAEQSRKQTIAKNLLKLRQRREKGEIDQEAFPLGNIYYINDEDYGNRPLTQEDLKQGGRNQALVLSTEEFRQFGYITILLDNGQELDLFADDFSDDPEDLLVIFPEDLGSLPRTTMPRSSERGFMV